MVLKACIPCSRLREIIDFSGHIQSGAILLCDINVYGLGEIGDDIGLALAKLGYFLQDPNYLAEGTIYTNSQCLKLPKAACVPIDSQHSVIDHLDRSRVCRRLVLLMHFAKRAERNSLAW